MQMPHPLHTHTEGNRRGAISLRQRRRRALSKIVESKYTTWWGKSYEKITLHEYNQVNKLMKEKKKGF